MASSVAIVTKISAVVKLLGQRAFSFSAIAVQRNYISHKRTNINTNDKKKRKKKEKWKR